MSQPAGTSANLRVLSDALPMQVANTRERGIGRYTAQALEALLQQPADGLFEVLCFNAGLPQPEPFVARSPTPYFTYFGDYPLAKFRADHWRESVPGHERYWHKLLKRFSADLFHIHNAFEWQTPAHGMYAEVALVATVHDLIPLRLPEFYRDSAPVWLRKVYDHSCELIRRADQLIVNSECTRSDIVDLLGVDRERITVAPPGLTTPVLAMSNPKLAAVLRKRLKLTGSFILCNSGYDPRKNLTRLFEAYARLDWSLRNQYNLVLVCRLEPPQAVELWAKARALAIDEQLIVTNYLSDEELAILYRMATLQFFPSLYEGFGMPVLNAFAAGLPVITSRNSALQELAEGAAILIDPTDVPAMADALISLLTDEPQRVALAERGRARAAEYPWQRTASGFRTAYAQARSPRQI